MDVITICGVNNCLAYPSKSIYSRKGQETGCYFFRLLTLNRKSCKISVDLIKLPNSNPHFEKDGFSQARL